MSSCEGETRVERGQRCGTPSLSLEPARTLREFQNHQRQHGPRMQAAQDWDVPPSQRSGVGLEEITEHRIQRWSVVTAADLSSRQDLPPAKRL